MDNKIIVIGVGLLAYLFLTKQSNAATAGGKTAAKPAQNWNQSPVMPIAKPSTANNLQAAGLTLLDKLLSGGTAPITRPPGYTPGYFPDTAGEAAAQSYYNSNQDLFAANLPTQYNADNNIPLGWADAQ